MQRVVIPRSLPSFPWRLAHLAALWAYGVAQPTFSMLQGNPEFLVVRGSTRADVAVFAFVLTLVPPLAVLALEALLGRLPGTLDRVVHLLALWLFGSLAALQVTRLLDLERGASLLLPLIPALLLVLAYLRWRVVQSFLAASLALPVIGLVAFVATVPLAIDDAPAANVTVAKRAPVVLVVLDELPVSSLLKGDGALDSVRYPAFGRLARQGTWYPRTTTVHDYTTQAVPSILTGRDPGAGYLPTLADHPDNLFTLLGNAYDLHVQEEVTHLCPTRYCPSTRRRIPAVDRQRGLLYDATTGYLHRILPRSLRTELPPIGERWGGFGEDVEARDRVLGALNRKAFGVVAAHAEGSRRQGFEKFLDSLAKARGGNELFFLHSILPHSPWRFLPSGRRYGNSDAIEAIRVDWQTWAPSQLLVEQSLQRHLLQVGYTDRLLGALLRGLDRVGMYDKSLLIVTADHGASFEPGGTMRLATRENVANVASVPLFVKYPDQTRGRVDQRFARVTDVLPTIADALDVELPWRVDGSSLLGEPRVRPVRLASDNGASVSAPAAAVYAQVRATARRNATVFGEGRDSMYRVGPHPALVGRPLATVPWRTVQGASVRFAEPARLSDVDLSSGSIPAHVVGEIDSVGKQAGRNVAIAVNGTFGAVTTSFRWDGEERFSALVPETVFRDGRNTVEVFLVERLGGSLRLTRLGGTAA